jgi:DNA polymerase III delta prime subunit
MAPREHFAWVEKYRPQTLDDCILPDSIKQTFNGILSQKDTPNLLLTGRAGVGKTTVAKALCQMLDVDFLCINASDSSGIDTVRGTIKDFASSLSLDGRRKYVILDEADMLTFTAQPALRSMMEEFARQCGFIFTANYPARIIPALHSRCSLVDFKIPVSERPAIAEAFAKRVIYILNTEHIKFDQKVALGVVKMYFPDFRRTLNELQRFSSTGALSDAILSQMSDKEVGELFAALKSKEYGLIRKWVYSHEDLDPAAFYRTLSDNLLARFESESLPSVTLAIANYDWQSALCADKQLNALACLVELQNDARFK